MRDKGVKNVFVFLIGAVWCVAMFYGAYFYYTGVMGLYITDMPKWFMDGIYIFIAVFGLIAYFLYDRFVYVFRIFINNYLKRILK